MNRCPEAEGVFDVVFLRADDSGFCRDVATGPLDYQMVAFPLRNTPIAQTANLNTTSCWEKSTIAVLAKFDFRTYVKPAERCELHPTLFPLDRQDPLPPLLAHPPQALASSKQAFPTVFPAYSSFILISRLQASSSSNSPYIISLL